MEINNYISITTSFNWFKIDLIVWKQYNPRNTQKTKTRLKQT